MRLFLSTRDVVLVALLITAAGAAAQSPLVVSPDTLFYQAETDVVLTNASDVAVEIDSIAVRFGEARAYGFVWVEGGEGGEDREGYYLNADQGSSAVIDEPVGPGQTRRLRIAGLDPCIACRGHAYIGADTLLVYSAGAVLADTVLIDLSGYVDVEEGPEAAASFRVTASPNPASGEVTLNLTPAVAREGEVVVADALGRVVARRRLGAGVSSVQIRTSRLAPGVYGVHVWLATGERATTRVTIVR